MKTIFVKINSRYIPEYCLLTKIVLNADGKKSVIKEPVDDRAHPHLLGLFAASQSLPGIFSKMDICPCERNDEGIVFDFIRGKTYLELLQEATLHSSKQYVDTWRDFLSLLVPDETVSFMETDESSRLFGDMAGFTGRESYAKCAIDLTPSNVIVPEEGRPVLIDYEWWVPKPVPVELIQYHAVNTTWQFHSEVRHNDVTLNALLAECGYDKASIERCDNALQYFYRHIGGNAAATEPYYLCLPNYVKQSVPVGQFGIENIQLKQLNAQLIEQMDQERRVREDMLAGWREAVHVTELLREDLKNKELAHAKEQEAMLQKNDNLQEQMNLLLSSRSWRITKPLRCVKPMIKRVVGRSARGVCHVIKRVSGKTDEAWPPEGMAMASGESAPVGASPKRIAIYHLYDKDGQVDRFVLHFLKALSEITAKIIFVSNGPLQKSDIEKIRKYAWKVVIRENKGFDAWGMKTGLKCIGRRRLNKYDELLLVNGTFFGPVYDLKQVFDGMSNRAVDFWGLTSHPGFDFDPFNCNPYGFIPAHVQNYWVTIRKRMFSSNSFWTFWKKLPPIQSYSESIGLYETVFTRYFSDLGYKWDTWVNPSDYSDLTDNPLIATPVEAIRRMHCPIIKWRAFFQDYDYLTSFTAQHTASYLMDYIRDNLDYPVDYVWEHLIRTTHMCDLTRNMHLAELLDKYHYYGPSIEETVEKHPIALFIHLYDETMAGELAAYASHMPDGADIWISTTSEQKKDSIQRAFKGLKQKVVVRVCENRGRDVSALLTSFSNEVMDYEIICVTHDKKTAHLHPGTVGEGFAYMGYENILSSKEYVANVIQTFINNPFLGLLYAPDPNHADFATHIGLEWGDNYTKCKALADELGLNVPMDAAHPPCAPFGSNFWIRTSALRPLYNKKWTYEDFPREPLKETDSTIMHAIERIYPFCAQHAGYYSALLMTTEYSAVEIGNLEFYAQTYAHMCFENGIANRYITVRDILDQLLGPVNVAPAPPEEVQQAPVDTNPISRVLRRIREKLMLWASES